MDSAQQRDLLEAFRAHYYQFSQGVQEAIRSSSDSTTLERLGDDLDQFSQLVEEHSAIFDSVEFGMLRTNVGLMQNDIRQQYNEVLDQSHHGRPVLVEQVQSGNCGRPAMVINPDFLRWAYSLRSTSSISRFLNISRQTVRNALLEYGIATPQANPFDRDLEAEPSNFPLADEILDASLTAGPEPHASHTSALSNHGPAANPLGTSAGQVVSFTGPLSGITDHDLDTLVLGLRQHYPQAGITVLDGMLRQLGQRVPRERIRHSLLRIDPVRRVFERIRIRRRVYSVPGPNSLWHHDGQHGLIRWGIVIHGFIDGYSRLITGLQANDNNRAQTVLDLFQRAAEAYGVPSHLRGDHGVENLLVAAFMESLRGERRGSYIWGRSVHNVRIERLWVDITAQIGASWGTVFSELEVRHGLDINNIHHIWLLHRLFLPTINQQLSFFAESWSQHRIQIRRGPNRSPADMFGFDMLVHGIRGSQLPQEEEMNKEELEVYGVDWEGLQNDQVLTSVRQNAPTNEEPTSWVGRVGPPERLNEVPLESPAVELDRPGCDQFDIMLQSLLDGIQSTTVESLWTHGLAYCHEIFPDRF